MTTSAASAVARDQLSRIARIDVPFTAINLTSTAAAVILPFFYHSRSSILAFAVLYTCVGLGLTAGYHRLFAHKSYSVPQWLEHWIAVTGYLAIQRGPIFWVAMHRLHHQYSDLPGRDPHTPKEGVWHVHFGWVHKRRADVWDTAVYHQLAPELLGDPLYRWMDRESSDYLTYFTLLAGSFLVGGVAGGGSLAAFDSHNAICFLVWVGILLRVALFHAFGLINSVCHLIGSRPFQTRDLSVNNAFVAMVIFGEGWHNNHHAFPGSARQGLRWYQLDPAWYFICLLKWLGLAKNVRVAGREAVVKKIHRDRGIRLPRSSTTP
jgi:fatty-acid desaturase